MAKASAPKILHLDIETRPALAYVWRGGKQVVTPEQIKEADGIICWSAKWHGKRGMKFGAYWEDPKYLSKLWDLLVKADAVVTYNGDGFDLPKIKGQLIRFGLPPLPPLTSIDLYKFTRKLGYFSAKLMYLCWLLGIGSKIKHHGFKLWPEVLDGVAASRRIMKRYNKKDVTLLEELYVKLRPYLDKHPHLVGGLACSNCGSTHLQKRGTRLTRTMEIDRLECQSCGAWPPIGARRKRK